VAKIDVKETNKYIMNEAELIPFEQGQIIGLLLSREEFCQTYIDHMTPNLFSDIYRSVFTSIKDYWKKYNKTIPNDILCKEILFREGSGFTEEKKLKLFAVLSSFTVEDRSIEYVTKSMERFIKMQNFANTLTELVKQSKSLKNDEEFSNKIAPLVKKVEDSLSPIVKTKPELAYEGLDDRTEYRNRVYMGDIVREGVPVGIGGLDKKLPFGGLENGWIGIVIGSTGRGKSIFLLQSAYAASVRGFNVVFVTLELSNQMLLDRYDSLAAYFPISNLVEHASSVRNKIVSEKDNPIHGKDWGEVAFLDFSDRELTVSQLKTEIEKLKSEQGFETHLLVVDYLDLLKPDRRRRVERSAGSDGRSSPNG
jgi:replicative DNA helicase